MKINEIIKFCVCILQYISKSKKSDNFFLLYNDFIVNIYIQLDWEQVFTTYQSLSIQIY